MCSDNGPDLKETLFDQWKRYDDVITRVHNRPRTKTHIPRGVAIKQGYRWSSARNTQVIMHETGRYKTLKITGKSSVKKRS